MIGDLPLNADMVAIIGNKGSGKSALADILALAGNNRVRRPEDDDRARLILTRRPQPSSPWHLSGPD
jgi:ABC-type thiamine transport system ATPase subunit